MTLAKAVARAWTDPDFKAKLEKDPKAALADVGVNVPDYMSVKLVKNTPDTMHVVLPVEPKTMDALDVDELENVAGGTLFALAGTDGH